MLEPDQTYQAISEKVGLHFDPDALLRWHFYRFRCVQGTLDWHQFADSVEESFGAAAVLIIPDTASFWFDFDTNALRLTKAQELSVGLQACNSDDSDHVLRVAQWLTLAQVTTTFEVLAFLELVADAQVMKYAKAITCAISAMNVSFRSIEDLSACRLSFLKEIKLFSAAFSLFFEKDELDFIEERRGSPKRKQVESTFDDLLKRAKDYRSSKSFQEMITFTAKFRDYAPYNNMLVKVQNPSCSFYATERDWRERFKRTIKEDGRPMLILAPMHPVMLVYDTDETEGEPLPDKLTNFAKVTGDYKEIWMERLLHNLERDRILVEKKRLSSTNAGFATTRVKSQGYKLRIALHNELSEAAAFSVLCHEAAHIYLGHLGGDVDGWWPARHNLSLSTVEIEAEAVSYIIANHLGLDTTSDAYVSGYISGHGEIPPSVSIEWISKVAGKILERTRVKLPKRKAT